MTEPTDTNGCPAVCDWSFTISLNAQETNDTTPKHIQQVPQHIQQAFERDGFVAIANVVSRDTVNALHQRLDQVLQGHYDRGQAPDKIPHDLTSSTHDIALMSTYNNKVVQIVNIHKADSLFRQLACNPALGRIVADLAQWKQGTRLAQDQVWAKRPGSSALAFHVDAPYFMFEPNQVVTVWVALDDMHQELGPLEYVRGSHQWGPTTTTTSRFFQASSGRKLVEKAAIQAGVSLDIVNMAGLPAGSISIHDGQTWHGSGPNTSRQQPRRGLGLHFVPKPVQFTREAFKSRTWRPYVEHALDCVETVELSTNDFPITWSRSEAEI